MALGECFQGCLSKPQVMIDDQRFPDWRRLIQVHPNSGEGQTVESYRTSLGAANEPIG